MDQSTCMRTNEIGLEKTEKNMFYPTEKVLFKNDKNLMGPK